MGISRSTVHLLLLAAAACSARGDPNPDLSQSRSSWVEEAGSYRYAPPPQLDDGWRTAAVEEVGLAREPLERMTEAIRRQEYANVHAVLIVKDDRLVYEEYFPGTDRRWRDGELRAVALEFHRDTLHDTRSVGKSITSALVGIALASGAIASLDTPLVAFFPEHADLATPEKRRITLRHALSMNAGLDWNELDVPYTDPANHSERMYTSTDPAGFLLARPMAGEPGTWWSYNSGLPTLLGLVISRTTGRPFGAYAREVLFEPLGITDVEWGGARAWTAIPELAWRGSQAWARVANPGGSLWIRPRDLLKFGSLYLNGGRWNGRQVIPADWVEESTRRHIAVTDSVSDHSEHGYGYLWWHDRFRTDAGELEVHTASGNGGQRIFVIPTLNLAVTVLAGRYNDPEANWLPEQLLLRYIVPAARGSERSRPSALVFVHATVVDVRDGSLLPDRTVLADGDRIHAVGPSGVVAVPEGAQVIDARGKYLIPGLWDMHAHQLWSNDTVEQLFLDFDPSAGSFSAWETYYGPALDLLVAAGVTGFRDPWGNLEVARRVRREAHAGRRLAPRFVVAGSMIDGEPPLWPGTLVPDGPAHGRALVDSLVREGADFIKVQSRLPANVFAAIADQARSAGVAVVGHVPWRVRALEAARAGMTSMEHLNGVLEGCTAHEDSILVLNRAWTEAKARGDDAAAAGLDRHIEDLTLAPLDNVRCRALLQRLTDLEVWQVPTLVVSRNTALLRDTALLSDERLRWIHPELLESWRPENDPRFAHSTEDDWDRRRRIHERRVRVTGMLAEFEAPILAGTDYPNPYIIPGFGLHDELELLVEAGLTPLQALQAATLNPARFLEATDSLGTIEPGKLADLVLLEANPLENIRNTQRIHAVVLNGRHLDRQALDALLARAAARSAGTDDPSNEPGARD